VYRTRLLPSARPISLSDCPCRHLQPQLSFLLRRQNLADPSCAIRTTSTRLSRSRPLRRPVERTAAFFAKEHH